MNSDNILVLKQGEIVEQGTHNNLLAANGEYARMWNSQQQAMEIEAKIKAMREHAASLNIDAVSPRDPTEASQPSGDSLRSLPNVAAAAQRVIKEAQHSSKV
jgi:ABC-type glutathione transport system ATPase component